MIASGAVLVTGATGFIGRATIKALVDAGWKVTAGSRSSIDALPDRVVRLDLAQPATILAMEKTNRFAAIVHLGARVDLTGKSAPELFAINALSTGCLAYLAGVWDAQLIFASTAIVHGVRTERIAASSPLCLDTPYAKSKWLGEQLIETSNARHCVLRIAGVFGCEGPFHLGLNRAIDVVRKSEPPVQIGSGKALRNYIYVKDVADAIVHSLRENLGGTHLLAGNESRPISALLRELCDVFLPGKHPVVKGGPEATDQVIEPSKFLSRTRGFREALIDMQRGECR